MIYFGEKYEDMSEKLINKEIDVSIFCYMNWLLFKWDMITARKMTEDYYHMCENLNKDAIKEWCSKYRYKMKMLKEDFSRGDKHSMFSKKSFNFFAILSFVISFFLSTFYLLSHNLFYWTSIL